MIGVNTKTITRLRDHLLVEGSRKSVFMAGAEALEHPLEGDDEAKEVLDAVAEAMYLMISADGKIEETEREVLRGALRELTVGAMRSAMIEQLLAGFEEAKQKEGQEARMNAIASVLCERPEAAEAAFVLSAAVAFADNEIADEENDVLNGFAEKLGISTERAEELLDGLEADGSEMIPALAFRIVSAPYSYRIRIVLSVRVSRHLACLTTNADASNLRAPLPPGGLMCRQAGVYADSTASTPRIAQGHHGLRYPAVLAHPAPQAVHQRDGQQARASPLWHPGLPRPRRRLRSEGR